MKLQKLQLLLFSITVNAYLYCGERWDSDLGFYYLRARYLNPDSGRFWTMDGFEGDSQSPLSLHKYLYCANNPLSRVDPSGNMFIDFLATALIDGMVQTLNLAGRVAPGAYMAAGRLATWYLMNQARLMLWSALTTGALSFINVTAEAILKNKDTVILQNGNPGEWVQQKIGANATQYELIDDFRDGNITSIKTCQRTMDRCLREIEKEAETLANRVSDIQPMKGAPSSVKPISMSAVQTRTLMMVVPEESAMFIRNSEFLTAVARIQSTTRVMIQFLPLRGWKK